VAAWKEHGLRRLAEDAADLVAERVPVPNADVVAFVPGDRARSSDRGHHPAQRLAEALAERWGMPCEPLLVRARPARRQAGLPLAERRRNVTGAFAVRTSPPESIVLVDDVYTTGSTVSAAASAFRSAGAGRVDVVTFARTIRFFEAT